jgi:hypothetical protein
MKTLPTYRCKRCGHKWHPRVRPGQKAAVPLRCASCTSPYWNVSPKVKKKSGETFQGTKES